MKLTMIAAATFSALALLSTYALAQGRTYAEPYPYHKSDPARGYALYQLHGCNDYEVVGAGRVTHVCDRKSPVNLFRLLDKDGQGQVAAAE